MKNNQKIGEAYRLELGLHSDDHELFYEYLLISPSYRLAHEVVTGQGEALDMSSRINKWDLLLKNYALCGDVYSMPFLMWWDAIGRGLFYTKQSSGAYLPTGVLQLITNKINEISLLECLGLVNDKARLQVRNAKRVENWRLGVETDIKSKWAQQLKGSTKKTHDNLEARTTLGILVSKKLKEALYIAENAARGAFPQSTPIDSALEFDYLSIYQLLKINIKMEFKNSIERKTNGLYVPKSYFARKVKPKQDKAKKIQLEVERQIKLRSGNS